MASVAKTNFKSITDILNIDGQDGSFDDDAVREAKERQEQREADAVRFKNKIQSMKTSLSDDEYKKEILKMLISEGSEVLIHMKHDIEDNPSARSAECFATLLSSLTNTVGEMEKIDHNAKKIDIDNKKLTTKTQGALVNGSNNVVMVGSTNDLLNMLQEGGIIGNKAKTIEAKVVSEHNDRDEQIQHVE
jgi:hypothetical protein